MTSTPNPDDSPGRPRRLPPIVGGDGGQPPPPEYAPTIARIADKAPRWLRRLQRAARPCRRAQARLEDLDLDAEQQDEKLGTANEELKDAEERRRRSHWPKDRNISTGARRVFDVIAVVLQGTVDAGALLILGLPLVVTIALAIVLAVVQLWAAHVAGAVSKRAHIDGSVSDFELNKGRLAFSAGLGIAIVLGLIRGLFASTLLGALLGGLLFVLAGVIVFLFSCWVAYSHYNDPISAVDRGRHQQHKEQRRVRDAHKRVAKADQRLRRRHDGYLRKDAAIRGDIHKQVAGAQARWRENNPDKPAPAFPELEWLDVEFYQLPERPPRRRALEAGHDTTTTDHDDEPKIIWIDSDDEDAA